MKNSFTVVLLLLFCALFCWWFYRDYPNETGRAGSLSPPAELVPFRTAGGTLHTNGFIKTETIYKETGSWLGTTSSSIRLNAIYRYDIELRSKDWNIYLDDARKVAFVVAPPFHPQLPVAVDSRGVQEWTESGWGRFNKWEHLRDLRRETSAYLAKQAGSNGYLEVARGQARITVEEFVADWLLKRRGWPDQTESLVKVYFADEADIPFPANKSLKDFLP